MKHDLIEIFGITSKKSLEVKFPSVPEEYLSHFVRGDGNINYKGYFISFVGGSYEYMNSLKDILRLKGFNPDLKTYSSKHHRVFVSGRKTIKAFSEWIYQDKDLYLRRKHEVFQQEKPPLEMLEDTMKNYRQNRYG
ncbi:hypothetical protein [Metabacillus sp. RGM 3146]|uniref:hypothetical protein n=1 Tax=Metabacillus sp. RGM 3146 TaxID=3401092 RepID=UPI003B9C38D4